MRALVLLALLFGLTSIAQAQPLRVNVICEETGRTKACPAFLLGILDEHKVFLQSPRANADVIVYVNATEVALVDRLLLRFVATVQGAPAQLEVTVELDTRADDDTQLEQLKPAFMRGMALYVAARFPKLVTVEVAEPEGDEAKPKSVSPWDLGLELGGFASKSGPYQNYNLWSSLGVERIQTRKRLGVIGWFNGGLNRQPPLEVDDGMGGTRLVSTNTSNYHYGGQLEAAWLYNHCYSIGSSTSTWKDDPYGQFRYGWDAKAGVEWDRYRADDPRGNRLSVAYIFAYRVEGYNLQNELGERWAHYPTHKLVATGSVRKDKIQLGMWLEVGGEVIHPLRRHALSASPSMEIQIGPRVDVNFSFSITKRELPGPDESVLDPDNYQQLSRLSYAEPLQMNGSFNVRIHWDRTNGQRNNRLDML
jgi:hypothetical protein